MHTSSDARYAEVSKRLNPVTSTGAALITVLQLLVLWGRWHPFLILLGIQAVVIVFNVWISTVGLPRYGRKAEIVRTAINASSGLAIVYWVGFTLPLYLWLPFAALAFDHLGRRLSLAVTVTICATFVTLSLLEGQPWILPVTFAAFAVFCSEISRARFHSMRDMIAESERQRNDLERVHVEMKQAYERLAEEVAVRQRIEAELRQAQKLEAVGRLAAGVAHEINTPVQFVTQNVEFLRDGIGTLVDLTEKSQALCRSVAGGASIEAAEREMKRIVAKADLPYLAENLPSAVTDSLAGLERIADIVRAMKRFAHPEGTGTTVVDLNEALASTLTIAKHEYKLVADVETDLAKIPPVACRAGEVNQVILNLVVNAAHAIADAVGQSGSRGRIRVETSRDGDGVAVAISDTGCGIPDAIRHRIFDPFFTTKSVGRGTGQGLAIARSVVEAHAGTLTFTTEVGRGSTFRLWLPIDPAELAAA